MNELLKSKLFSLLTESSQESTKQKMQNAYGCFTEQVRTVSQSEHTYSEIYRILNNTRVELVFLKSLYRHEQGEKCLKNSLSSKSCPIS